MLLKNYTHYTRKTSYHGMIKNSCYISNRNIIIILNVTTENDFVNVLWLLLCNMCRLIKGSLIIFKMDNDDTCKESIVRLNIGQCPLIISTITCTIIIIPLSLSFSLSLSLSSLMVSPRSATERSII